MHYAVSCIPPLPAAEVGGMMISPRVVVIICTSSSLARSLRAFIALEVISLRFPPPPAVGEGHPENFAGCHGFIVVRILRLVPELFAARLGSGSASDARTEPVVAQVQEEPVGSGTPLAPSPERRRDQWPVFAAGRQADV